MHAYFLSGDLSSSVHETRGEVPGQIKIPLVDLNPGIRKDCAGQFIITLVTLMKECIDQMVEIGFVVVVVVF